MPTLSVTELTRLTSADLMLDAFGSIRRDLRRYRLFEQLSAPWLTACIVADEPAAAAEFGRLDAMIYSAARCFRLANDLRSVPVSAKRASSTGCRCCSANS
jgi:hypothetical protein